MKKPTDEAVLLHWGKRQEVYEEIFHRLRVAHITFKEMYSLLLEPNNAPNINAFDGEKYLRIFVDNFEAWTTLFCS